MEQEKKANGAFVGLVIIIIILVLGGIYIWKTNQKVENSDTAQQETITDQDAAALNALESDANTTDTSTGVDVSTVH